MRRESQRTSDGRTKARGAEQPLRQRLRPKCQLAESDWRDSSGGSADERYGEVRREFCKATLKYFSTARLERRRHRTGSRGRVAEARALWLVGVRAPLGLHAHSSFTNSTPLPGEQTRSSLHYMVPIVRGQPSHIRFTH